MKLHGTVPNSYIMHHAFSGSVCLFGFRKIGRPILGIYSKNSSQIHERGNWEAEHYNAVLEIMRWRSFISGKT
jgi:hypothetical protein